MDSTCFRAIIGRLLCHNSKKSHFYIRFCESNRNLIAGRKRSIPRRGVLDSQGSGKPCQVKVIFRKRSTDSGRKKGKLNEKEPNLKLNRMSSEPYLKKTKEDRTHGSLQKKILDWALYRSNIKQSRWQQDGLHGSLLSLGRLSKVGSLDELILSRKSTK